MENEIVDQQLRFFVEKRAGCLFAAAAARDPRRYGWVHLVLADIQPNALSIDAAITTSIQDTSTTTLSLLFPSIRKIDDLLSLIETLRGCQLFELAQIEEDTDSVCLGFRALIGQLRSYVTGFGNFPFLPATRRAPHVELTMRVKLRPQYEFTFKEAPPDIIHLADMDMMGMSRDKLWQLWNNSFIRTRAVLGANPDLRSAARTTYSIPKEFFQH